MDKKNYTIIDIARMLRLSKSTVSRALRDQYDVNPETREKVQALARELQYETNTIAASLRAKRSNIIGVVIPSFSIPFYAFVLGYIQDAAARHGYNIMVCQTGDKRENEIHNIAFLLKSRVDGILVSLSSDNQDYKHILDLKKRAVPVVLFDRVSEDLDLPMVLSDDYLGGFHAAKHLVQGGCKRIAHIAGPAALMLSRKREQGFRDGIAKAGGDVLDELFVASDFTLNGGKDAMRKILATGINPDALFCVSDTVALGAMEVIRKKGLIIPDDISVVGFTDEPVASLVSPPLTTVAQPIEEIGTTAVELLLEYINDINNPDNRKRELITTSLIVRDSTRI